MKHFIIAAICLAFLVGSTFVARADNCTYTTQSDGTVWGTCVDENGRSYCVVCESNSCRRVRC